MRRGIWMTALLIGLWAGVAQAMEGGDFAPPVVVLDHQGAEVTVDTQSNEAVMLVLFEAWNPTALNEYRAWEKSTTFAALGDIKAFWVSYGALREIGERSFDGKLPETMYYDPYLVLSKRYQVDSGAKTFVLKRGKVVGAFVGLPSVVGKPLKALMHREGFKGQFPTGEQVAPKVPTYSFVRSPAGSAAGQDWGALARYITSASELQVDASIGKNPAQFEDDIANGKLDVFNAGPLLCYNALKHYEPLVLVERRGRASYHGIAFSLRNGRVSSFNSLKGKTVGMVSPSSTSGGLYPQQLLLEKGLNLTRDIRIKWLGSHKRVAQAVKNRWVDAGMCFEDCRDLVWKSADDKSKYTRLLGFTEQIPSEMVMVRRDLPQALKDRFLNLIVEAASRGDILAEISQGEPQITGFRKVNETIFETLESVKTTVAKAAQKGK